jgi:NTP pyrophosphatase (non-canonical NTP hydrolase)
VSKLHPHVAEALDLLQEECGEVVQARSKLRRGRDEGGFMPPKRRPNGPTNLTEMKAEIMDLMVLIDYLENVHGLITREEDHSVGIATHRGSVKRSHAAEGKNFVD